MNKYTFDYLVPFNSELAEMDLLPFKASDELIKIVNFIFRHPHNKYNKLTNRYFDKHPHCVHDMSTVAIGMVRYYLLYPQQYGNKLENLYTAILVRMHKQFVKWLLTCTDEVKGYMPTHLKLLSRCDLMWDQILSDISKENYQMYKQIDCKKRPGVSMRGRYSVKPKVLKYYESL